MRTINRRELNQHSGRILDEVLASGEPVEVVTRGGRSVVISPRSASLFEDWVRRGMVMPAEMPLDEAPRATSPRSVDEIRRDVDADR